MRLKQIEAGVYTDEDEPGALHIVLPEFLDAHGYADTPANREMIVKTWNEELLKRGISSVTVLEK